MFGEVKSFENRKRAAPELMTFEKINQKENVYTIPEKKQRISQIACEKCLSGDSGHITHVLKAQKR